MTQAVDPPSEQPNASQLVGLRLKQIRRQRGFTAADLAARCEQLGAPDITRSVIANLESGRRDLNVERLLVLALACDVAPIDLLTPSTTKPAAVHLTSSVTVSSPTQYAAWLVGRTPLPQSDPIAFAAGAVQRLATSPVDNSAAALVRSVATQQALYENAGTAAARLAKLGTQASAGLDALETAIKAGSDPATLLDLIATTRTRLELTTTESAVD